MAEGSNGVRQRRRRGAAAAGVAAAAAAAAVVGHCMGDSWLGRPLPTGGGIAAAGDQKAEQKYCVM